MGNYNTQYQSYYNNLAKKQRGTNNFASEGKRQSKSMDFYIQRLTKELIGVLVLIMIVIILKMVVTPKTQYAYNYSKEVINKPYNYSILIKKAKNFRLNDIQVISVNFMEKIKNKFSMKIQ